MNKVVTFGEVMLRLSAPNYLRLTQCNQLNVSYAGAEANVAVSLANYGIPVEYVTCLPDNPLARKCLKELKGNNVSVNHCLTNGERMGIIFVETGSVNRPSRVFYDRSHSAIAMSQIKMFNWEEIFEDATWFHWTGITPGLSQSDAEVILEALQIAKQKKMTISCDLNYRSKLWKYGKSPSEVMPKLISYCDIILGNEEDCEMMFNIKPKNFNVNNQKNGIEQIQFESVCKQMMEKFPQCKLMAVTLRGAINANHNIWSSIMYTEGKIFKSKQYDITHIVDRIGGGDSFMGGLIYGLITYPQDQQHALEFATAASCLKHTIHGDYNEVSIEEVESLIIGESNGRVKR